MATVPETHTDKQSRFGAEAAQALRVGFTGNVNASARVVFLFITIAIALTYVPQPLAGIGVAFLVLLALDWGRRR